MGSHTGIYFSALNADLGSPGNAVSPRVTWPVTLPAKEDELVAASTTPPSHLQQYGALNFPLWQNIGEEFMVKSNVNNWIACTPNTGSFSRWIEGSINCRMIKSITSICPNLPNEAFSFGISPTGPAVRAKKLFYYFESDPATKYPAHDPCGLTQANNNLPGIHPEGQIWLR